MTDLAKKSGVFDISALEAGEKKNPGIDVSSSGWPAPSACR
jgi:hypothetical protein